MLNLEVLNSEKYVMAIVNCTPDSFYAKSRVDKFSVLDSCRQHIQNGATILDIGGYSSRPNAQDISVEEEIERVIPVIRAIRLEFPSCIVSVDTFRKEVAEQAINAGANIINDISGGKLDKEMLSYVAQNKIPYVLMHMRGNVQNMQENCIYKDLVKDIIAETKQSIDFLRKNGVSVIFDPGFGFSKTLDQNYELLNRLEEFRVLNCPILVGISRKSMIHKFLGISANDSLNGTSVLNSIALQKGASILRVHDSKEAVECVKIIEKLQIS
jgi:dihydropteroate synthase